jgi:hypothetical protein
MNTNYFVLSTQTIEFKKMRIDEKRMILFNHTSYASLRGHAKE